MGAPGANMSVVALVFVKHVTWSAAVVASEQFPKDWGPTLESQTAPTEMAPASQAGAVIRVPSASFPEEQKDRTPRARSVVIVGESGACEVSQLLTYVAKVPRLMLTTSTSGRFTMIQFSAAMMSLVQQKVFWAERTLTATIFASGATPTGDTTPSDVTMPATFVPCPLSSSAEPGPKALDSPPAQQFVQKPASDTSSSATSGT